VVHEIQQNVSVLKIMPMIALALACLAGLCSARRIHPSSKESQSSAASKFKPLNQFANILLGSTPAAGFHHHGLGVHIPKSNTMGSLGRGIRIDHHIPVMQVAEKLESAPRSVQEVPTEEVPTNSFPDYKQPSWFRFEVLHKSAKSRARVGRIHTPHGVIDTPGFVPVGTSAALKSMTAEQAEECGVQLQFANTYHLMVHPGTDIVARAGGLHKFMRRPDFPLITDSGGFQVFSLASTDESDGPELKRKAVERNGYEATMMKVNEDGVVFRSYFDGSWITLSPEIAVKAQKELGADIIIPLDELPPNNVSAERLAESVALSHRWETRSLQQHLADPRQQAMYAVVHGGTNRTLRAQSVDYLSSLPFDGYAIGGSLGVNRTELIELLDYLFPLLPEDKPNHVLGIAEPESVLASVPLGMDTCDSCFPTRVARHGRLFTRDGNINIRMACYKDDHGPIDPSMPTINYTRAYMHHLFRMHEPVFCSLASMHNIKYMTTLMAELREKIYADEI